MFGLVHSKNESRAKQRVCRGTNFNRHIEPSTHCFRISGQTGQRVRRFYLSRSLVRQFKSFLIGRLGAPISFHPIDRYELGANVD
jgi:hypothetical protein